MRATGRLLMTTLALLAALAAAPGYAEIRSTEPGMLNAPRAQTRKVRLAKTGRFPL
jgi:hypothetical protein